MDEAEKRRAEAEARQTVANRVGGARRGALWAGMNRYLATEAEHQHNEADRERAREAGEQVEETEMAQAEATAED